jgi:hypothetical protein
LGSVSKGIVAAAYQFFGQAGVDIGDRNHDIPQ